VNPKAGCRATHPSPYFQPKRNLKKGQVSQKVWYQWFYVVFSLSQNQTRNSRWLGFEEKVKKT
jgi:hypothetical protein